MSASPPHKRPLVDPHTQSRGRRISCPEIEQLLGSEDLESDESQDEEFQPGNTTKSRQQPRRPKKRGIPVVCATPPRGMSARTRAVVERSSRPAFSPSPSPPRLSHHLNPDPDYAQFLSQVLWRGPGEDGPDFGALLPESLEMGDRGLDEDDDDDDDEENDPDYKDLSCGHFGERQEKRNDPAVKVSKKELFNLLRDGSSISSPRRTRRQGTTPSPISTSFHTPPAPAMTPAAPGASDRRAAAPAPLVARPRRAASSRSSALGTAQSPVVSSGGGGDGTPPVHPFRGSLSQESPQGVEGMSPNSSSRSTTLGGADDRGRPSVPGGSLSGVLTAPPRVPSSPRSGAPLNISAAYSLHRPGHEREGRRRSQFHHVGGSQLGVAQEQPSLDEGGGVEQGHRLGSSTGGAVGTLQLESPTTSTSSGRRKACVPHTAATPASEGKLNVQDLAHERVEPLGPMLFEQLQQLQRQLETHFQLLVYTYLLACVQEKQEDIEICRQLLIDLCTHRMKNLVSNYRSALASPIFQQLRKAPPVWSLLDIPGMHCLGELFNQCAGAPSISSSDTWRLLAPFEPFFSTADSTLNAALVRKYPAEQKAPRHRRALAFSLEEDKLITEGLECFGVGHWSAVSKHFLPCRDKQQIFVRYKNLSSRNRINDVENPISRFKSNYNKPLSPVQERLLRQVVDLHGSRWQLISARYFPAHSGAFLHKWLDYMAEREVDPVAAEPPQRSMHLTSHQNSRASNSVGGSSLLDVPGDGVWGPPIPFPAAPCAPSPDPLASPQLLPPRSPQEERHHQPSLHNGGRTHDLSSHPEAAMPWTPVGHTLREWQSEEDFHFDEEDISSSSSSSSSSPATHTYAVETPGQKTYMPSTEDVVIGIIVDKGGENYRLDLGSGRSGVLSVLAFDGATKRNRPRLEVGGLVYCRVLSASKDLEPDLTCESPASRKSWVTGESVFNELKGGMLVECSLSLCEQLLQPDSNEGAAPCSSGGGATVLQLLGKRIPFELAVGVNGRVWVNAAKKAHMVLVANALKNAEHLTEQQARVMVHRLMDVMQHQFS